MSREKRFHIRLTEQEFAALQAEASKRDVSMADVMRDFIKTLVKKNMKSPQFPSR